MFDGINHQTKEYSNEYHLAEMVAYMSPPPLSFLKRPGVGLDYFDETGGCNRKLGRVLLAIGHNMGRKQD